MKVIIKLLSMLIFAVGCKERLLTKDISTFVESEGNGLKRSLLIGDWEYTIQYRPPEYILIQEGFFNDTNGKAQRQTQLDGMAWFNIGFRKIDFNQSPLRYHIRDNEEYYSRLYYFLNEAANDMHLIYCGDTIMPAAYAFDNNYNLTPRETMVVAFTLPEGVSRPACDMQLVMYDRVYGNGIIKAIIHKKNLDEISSF